METRVLEYFLRVTELGSINRAATELGLSQPSLSRWLALLEREIGTPLLTRTSRGVRTTDAGEQLAERTRPILRQVELLRDEVGRTAITQVALGMPSALQHLVTAPFVTRIAQAHPEAVLRVHEGINNSVRALMEDGSVDVGMMAASERSPDTFDMEPLVRERLMLVGPPSTDLAHGELVSPRALDRMSLILPGRPNRIRAAVEAAVTGAGGAFRRRIEAETLSLCLELARQGLGNTVMPYSAIHKRLAGDSALVWAPIEGAELTWSLCVNRARVHTVAVQRIVTSLRDFVTERLGAGEWPHARSADAPSSE